VSSKTENVMWRKEGLWQQFNEWLNKDPEAVAVYEGVRPLSRLELLRRADILAEQLSVGGIGKGHRVLFDSHTTVDTVVIGLALSKLGAIVCPINHKQGKHERQLIMERLGPTAHLTRRKEEGADELAGTEERMYVYWQSNVIIEPPAGSPAEETVLIGFTSGTTGIPKAVPHTASSLNYATAVCADIANLQPGDPIIAISPITSAAGWAFNVHMALSLGFPLILMGDWDPKRALELIDLHKCAWGMCVPTHLLLMMEVVRSGNWSFHLKSMKALAVGGSPNSEDMVLNAQKFLGIQVLRMYGMSECLGHASVRPADSQERKLIYDGIPFPGTHLEAYDSENRILPPGIIGQAGVRGPSQFKGYLPGLGAEQHFLTSDKAFLTGDLIIKDEEGFVRVVGRIKDQIIRGGYKIDAAEVEMALISHPAVVEAAVVSRPDELLGERICAVVAIRDAKEIPLKDLCEHLQDLGISKAKWPEFLFIVPSLPKTHFGKVDKNQVRELVLKENRSHV
jgi:non-ribosomal peptide synthetase component E (peptide arylation enzyme)